MNEELTIMEGYFKQYFTETGELVAIKAVAIPMPPVSYRYGYEFKIVEMVENGSMVNKGDTIIKLDPSTIEKFIISQQESLENEQAAAKKQEVEIRNGMQELEAKLKTELASYNMKKLELEKGQFESDNKKRIKDLQFQQANIKLDRVKRQLEMKPKLNSYDKRIQQIKVLQKEADLDGAQAAIDRMAVTCPEEGLFQVAKSMFNYPRQDLKVGDAVYRGALMARIPDIKRMKVKTIVNETDFTKISVGTKVIVRMDALPSVPFAGVVSEISRVCLPKDEAKVFNVQVVIDESDLRLKPGMTVSCEYICWEAEKVMYVPNKCVFKEGGHAYLFLDKGNKPEKVEVEIGVSNSHHTMIYSDLKPGQKLHSFEFILNQKST
jgi:multidrug efflux pump subunit AcrA (membrane-fusion protein)